MKVFTEWLKTGHGLSFMELLTRYSRTGRFIWNFVILDVDQLF